MALPRFFLQGTLAGTEGTALLPMAADDVHHAVCVLRVKPGDCIEVVDADGSVTWLVEVTRTSEDGIEGSVQARSSARPRTRVTLVQGVAKGEKMDDIVRHAIEIGADAIVPVLTERTVVRLKGPKLAEKGERWRRIAKSAAEQSHRDFVPSVSDPVGMRDVAILLSGFDAAVVLWEEERGSGLVEVLSEAALPDGAHVALIVGPEGGLSAGEVRELVEAGARPASLGDTILRTETAALVALALTVHHLGGLGRA